MIINAHAAFMTEGPLPEQARQRLEALGKQVRLINTNLWEFAVEFRTSDSIQGTFQGNEDFTCIQPSFTLADATALVYRTVQDTLTEFHIHGEIRVVSATITYSLTRIQVKKKEEA